MPQNNSLNQKVAVQESIVADIKKTQEEHGKVIHEIDKRTEIVQNRVDHVNTNLGDIIKHLKEVHKSHEARAGVHENRITVLEQHSIIANQKIEKVTSSLGELITNIKDDHKNHENRLGLLEQHDLVLNQQKLDTRLTTLEKQVGRAYWYGLGTLITASTALTAGISAYWHKIANLLHG